MKKVIILLALLTISLPCFADQYVKGYYRSNGTYVQPHYRTSPNSTRLDNYSTRGNYNPYTGQKGYKNPYPSYNSGYGNSRSRKNSYGL